MAGSDISPKAVPFGNIKTGTYTLVLGDPSSLPTQTSSETLVEENLYMLNSMSLGSFRRAYCQTVIDFRAVHFQDVVPHVVIEPILH